jgi:methylenetetrahydrofolate reductase (NADPH)
VTASPAGDLEDTIDLSRDLAALGFEVVPHLAARMTRDRRHLSDILEELRKLDIGRVFVVGGDADQRGDFPDGLALLEAMVEIGHGLTRIGIAGYPEGHAFIPDEDLWDSLAAKQRYANYMVTQMCFDPEAITAFVQACRSKGITLPVLIGLPGVAPIRKLATIAARLGVGPSIQFLSKHTSMLGRLVRPDGYAPDELIRQMIPTIMHPEADIRGFHIYTFNQVQSTEAWRQRMLAELDNYN